jgi:aminopeptidase-like protein
MEIGEEMYGWMEDLFPFNRSITGPGTRKTLRYLQDPLPDLEIRAVESGTKAFDWKVPKEWHITNAYIVDESGNRVVDWRDHNLHVVGYSEPVDRWMELSELDKHLYSLPDQPDAIPYVTSYYERRWGFCLRHRTRENLERGRYRAVIDSGFKQGVLNYGELVLPGEEDAEVFLSTYICHPSMANNELSGPVVAAALGRWLASLKDRRYTYRIIFIPETIGSIVYLSQNLEHLKERVIAGFNLTCLGDDRCYSYLPSRAEDTLADRVARHVLKHIDSDFKEYSFLDRGSDERQYCAPGVDLPVATIMRSKFGEYPEYHTSLDDLALVSPEGLSGSYEALKSSIEVIENNYSLQTMTLGEPNMGKRGLYPTIGKPKMENKVKVLMDIIAFSDGRDLLSIARKISKPVWDLIPFVDMLSENRIISLK